MNVNNTAILVVVITPGGIVMDGFILLLIFVIVFAAIMLLTTYSKRNCEYDERQLAIRAEGYKRGFFIMLVMTGMLCIINEARISVPFDNNFFLFAAMMLSVDVYAIHAIENGAFFSVNEKGLAYVVMVAIIIIVNAISAAGHIIDGTIKSDGKIMFDNGGYNLILLVGFLLMLTVFIHKYIKERKGYEES